jgi:hypothetical protein
VEVGTGLNWLRAGHNGGHLKTWTAENLSGWVNNYQLLKKAFHNGTFYTANIGNCQHIRYWIWLGFSDLVGENVLYFPQLIFIHEAKIQTFTKFRYHERILGSSVEENQRN